MLVRADEIRVAYGSRVAVDGITLVADAGVVYLIGPNGAGKSSLISVLAGTRRPDGGRVKIGDMELAGHSASVGRAQIGYLPQSFDLVGGMSLLDTVRYAAWCNLVPRSRTLVAARSALEAVELADRATERVRTLSGGQRQRLGLAAATAHRPALLLLDEPTVGLDPEQRVRFRSYLRAVAPTTCIVVATHLLEDTQLAAGRVVVLNRGRACFEGSVEALESLGEDAEGERHESALERGYRTALDHGATVG